ncbi:hypothetical protein [Methanobrevibacter sp.]
MSSIRNPKNSKGPAEDRKQEQSQLRKGNRFINTARKRLEDFVIENEIDWFDILAIYRNTENNGLSEDQVVNLKYLLRESNLLNRQNALTWYNKFINSDRYHKWIYGLMIDFISQNKEYQNKQAYERFYDNNSALSMPQNASMMEQRVYKLLLLALCTKKAKKDNFIDSCLIEMGIEVPQQPAPENPQQPVNPQQELAQNQNPIPQPQPIPQQPVPANDQQEIQAPPQQNLQQQLVDNVNPAQQPAPIPQQIQAPVQQPAPIPQQMQVPIQPLNPQQIIANQVPAQPMNPIPQQMQMPIQPVNVNQQNFIPNKVMQAQQAMDVEQPQVNNMSNEERKRQLKQQRYNKALARAQTMSADQLKDKYAKHAAQGKVKLQSGDLEIPFAEQGHAGAWRAKNMSAQTRSNILSNSKNNWIHAFDKARDFSYNPKMLDPQYAVWHGAKHGNDVYYTDINNDGETDIIEVDEDDKIKSYNGYIVRPSKQHLYNEYYSVDENKAIADHNGNPVYPNKFNDWWHQRAGQMSADERKTLNSSLAHKGMIGYKVKDATLNETIKQAVSVKRDGVSIYDGYMNALARVVNIDVKVVKRSLPISSFVGQIVRAVLFAHFNFAPTTNKGSNELNREADDRLVGKLSRIINSTASKKSGLKEAMVNYILTLFNNQQAINQALNIIWTNLVINRAYTQCITQLSAAVRNIGNQQLATSCQQAYAASNQASELLKQQRQADRAYKINPMKAFNGL